MPNVLVKFKIIGTDLQCKVLRLPFSTEIFPHSHRCFQIPLIAEGAYLEETRYVTLHHHPELAEFLEMPSPDLNLIFELDWIPTPRTRQTGELYPEIKDGFGVRLRIMYMEEEVRGQSAHIFVAEGGQFVQQYK